MSVREVTNSLEERANELHDVLIPKHPADRLGSRAGAVNAIIEAFKDIRDDVIASLDDVDIAAFRLRRAIENGEELDEADVNAVLTAYEEADAEIAELESKLNGDDLEERAPAVAEVLNALNRDQQLLRRLEKYLSEDGSDGAKLALTRLEEWRKDDKHEEEDL